MTTPVVLAAHVGYDDVAEALDGWDGPVDTVDGLDGPPVLARWTRDGAEVRWSSHPDLGLAVLEGSGVELLPPLARMRVGAAAADARSGDLATALRGTTALGLLGDPAALPALDALRADPTTPPPVRGAADLAVTRLGELATAAAADRLAHLRAGHPERAPVLGLLRDPVARRQALRGFLARPSGGPQHHRSVVLAGLADDDWEVRWSAVLAAHDLVVDDVLLEVRRCPVGRGPCSRQHQVLEAVRDVVGQRLSRRRDPADDGPAALWLDEPDRAPAADAEAVLLVASLRSPVPEPLGGGARPAAGRVRDRGPVPALARRRRGPGPSAASCGGVRRGSPADPRGRGPRAGRRPEAGEPRGGRGTAAAHARRAGDGGARPGRPALSVGQRPRRGLATCAVAVGARRALGRRDLGGPGRPAGRRTAGGARAGRAGAPGGRGAPGCVAATGPRLSRPGRSAGVAERQHGVGDELQHLVDPGADADLLGYGVGLADQEDPGTDVACRRVRLDPGPDDHRPELCLPRGCHGTKDRPA
ncbi:hypothetical protein [Nocardioides aequoreus]|uniref:hypothetical protein n=1 Tax=Nocardioides aequoreus TaxID=397278 RepID=UPI000B0A5D54|nr:hypothetical protein [Nocardioides aequoreus]